MSLVTFTAAMFLSAALVFAVQPMAGKTLLPSVGGTPAVWNTCLVFFQAVLLLGYLYADRLTRLTVRTQVVLHLAAAVLAIGAVVFLRGDPEWIPADSDYPIVGLIAFLAASFGVPFFVLSATAPLLQRWFATTGHRSAADPYFLYAASNAGSLIGLLGYPLAVEPSLTLDEQRTAWAIGFVVFVGLMGSCGIGVFSVRAGSVSDGPAGPSLTLPARTVLKWIALAALPSSLLMGTTTHLATDIAPVPLLWVVPLALYLVSFVIVFSRWSDDARRVLGRFTPMLLVCITLTLLTGATDPVYLVVGVHLAAFFAVALLCHGELARSRPPHEHLTTFYLAMSIGGVLGGLFNALAAPLLFTKFGLVEYPLAVVLAGLVRPNTPLRFSRLDALLVGAFAIGVGLLVWLVPRLVNIPADDPEFRLVRTGLMFGVPAMVAFALVQRPLRFAACLAVVLLAGAFDVGPHGETLHRSRNFFGTLRVARTADGKFTRLVHGTTQHGQQRAGSSDPLMYYHRTGPIGRLLTNLPPERRKRVAVVGLGCGAMAAYARPGEAWTFYEIDPGVVSIARNPEYFTFLRDCQVEPRIVLGDARRRLEHEPDGAFDLIVLDAFSSDAIPVHLLTREAFALYAKKLAPRGVLAFHLSNRYLDLPPLVARIGAAHDPPFIAKVDNNIASERDAEQGKFPSLWAVLTRDLADTGTAIANAHWDAFPPTPGPMWTDGFSNLLAVWKHDDE